MSVAIRSETPEDQRAIHHVHRAAFGTDDELELVDALWKCGCVEVSLVTEIDGNIVGHILFTAAVRVTDYRTNGYIPACGIPSFRG